MKYFFIISLLSSLLFCDSFNFSETRYSYAFDKSVVLQGKIEFEPNSLKIKYKNTNKTIIYKDSTLNINGDESLHHLSALFEILLLVYFDEVKLLEDKFEVKTMEDETTLIPYEEMSAFLKKIVLIKKETKLKEISIFLKNSDNIKISIEDEIR